MIFSRPPFGNHFCLDFKSLLRSGNNGQDNVDPMTAEEILKRMMTRIRVEVLDELGQMLASYAKVMMTPVVTACHDHVLLSLIIR